MTHKLLTSEQRAAIGVHDDLVRLSMGIEAPEDLVADVLQGLAAVCG
jgi:cystathionine beta-lyase/cystathionine gamma-synthase